MGYHFYHYFLPSTGSFSRMNNQYTKSRVLAPPYQFSQDTGEWPENQILIPDWTYFHCPGTTLLFQESSG